MVVQEVCSFPSRCGKPTHFLLLFNHRSPLKCRLHSSFLFYCWCIGYLLRKGKGNKPGERSIGVKGRFLRWRGRFSIEIQDERREIRVYKMTPRWRESLPPIYLCSEKGIIGRLRGERNQTKRHTKFLVHLLCSPLLTISHKYESHGHFYNRSSFILAVTICKIFPEAFDALQPMRSTYVMFPFPPGTEIKAFVLYLPRALSIMPYMPEKWMPQCDIL